MSDESVIRDYLIGGSPSAMYSLIGLRCYYVEAPQDVERPYVVYTLVDGLPENQMDGTPGIERYRVQIDCYADEASGAGAARQLLTAVRAELEWGDRALLISENFVAFEPDTRLFRASADFSLWLHR